MVKPNSRIIKAYRDAADKIESNPEKYNWGHYDRCVCGHVAQALGVSSDQITNYVKRFGSGGSLVLDWSHWASKYMTCATTGLSLNIVAVTLIDAGLDARDIQELEECSNPNVRNALNINQIHIIENDPKVIVQYLRTWANILEQELINEVQSETTVASRSIPSLIT